MNYYAGFLLCPYIQAPECFADISHIVLTTPLVSRDIFTPVCRWGSRGTEQLYLVMREAGDKGERQVPLSRFNPSCNAISPARLNRSRGSTKHELVHDGEWALQLTYPVQCWLNKYFWAFALVHGEGACCRETLQGPCITIGDVFSITWGTNLPTSKNNRPTDCISVNQMVCDWWGFFPSLA